jgi:hypothetical protein
MCAFIRFGFIKHTHRFGGCECGLSGSLVALHSSPPIIPSKRFDPHEAMLLPALGNGNRVGVEFSESGNHVDPALGTPFGVAGLAGFEPRVNRRSAIANQVLRSVERHNIRLGRIGWAVVRFTMR